MVHVQNHGNAAGDHESLRSSCHPKQANTFFFFFYHIGLLITKAHFLQLFSWNDQCGYLAILKWIHVIQKRENSANTGNAELHAGAGLLITVKGGCFHMSDINPFSNIAESLTLHNKGW